MSKCLDTCKKPTPAQAHCASCHVTFGGVTGFDLHRSNGQCLDPASFEYVEREGVWRRPVDHDEVELFKKRVGR